MSITKTAESSSITREGRALRTETTINNTRYFGIGKLLKNLPALRQIGLQANRRLLDCPEDLPRLLDLAKMPSSE